MTIEAVRKLPRTEKLRLMETLWEELSRSATEFESPPWHGKELAETERRLAAGKEQILDWETAKKKLRKSSSRREEALKFSAS
jgi:hypothetical protein